MVLENYELKNAVDFQLAYGMANRSLKEGAKLIESKLPWDFDNFKQLDIINTDEESNRNYHGHIHGSIESRRSCGSIVDEVSESSRRSMEQYS